MTVTAAAARTAFGDPARAVRSSPHTTRIGVSIVAVLAILLWTRTLGEYGASVVVVASINVIAVAGLHVLVHWAGQVSLAQVAFVAIGAFVTARANVDFGLPLPFAAMGGALGALAASLVVGLPALRLRGFGLAIVTLAFGFAASEWLFIQPELVPVSSGLPLRDSNFLGFDMRSSRELAVPVVVITCLVVALTVRLGSSALGRAMRLVSHDEQVGSAYGVSVGAHKLFAFAVAGSCAGLAGALTVMSIGRAGPSVFPPTQSVLYVSAVLLGGRGPVWGSVAAAVGLGALPILAGDAGHLVGLVGPLGILLVIRTSEDGLNGAFRLVARAVKRTAGQVSTFRQQEA